MTDFVGETPIKLKGTAGLLAAVPHSLGFHPANSIVLMCFSGQHRLGPVARFDLPRGGDDELIRQVVGAAVLHAEEVVVVCYLRTRRRPALLDGLLAQLDAGGIDIMSVLLVHAGRAWAAIVPRPLRLADSVPVPDENDPTMRVFAAANTLSGRGVLADREQVRASIAGPCGHRRRVAEAAIDAVLRSDPPWSGPTGPLLIPGVAPLPIEIDRLVDQALSTVRERGTVEVGVAAALAIGCADRDVRDGLLLRGLLELDPIWVPMLVDCVSWTPDWLAAGICGVLGAIAFRHGDGTLGQVAADRCFRAEPGHRLATMLVATISAGMRPDCLDQLLVPDDPDEAAAEPHGRECLRRSDGGGEAEAAARRTGEINGPSDSAVA